MTSMPKDPAVAKVGRPRAGDPRGEMAKVTFRVDKETLAALVELEATVGRRCVNNDAPAPKEEER